MAGRGNDASARASERMEESLQEFKEAFEALMSPTSEAPVGGRMSELERLWHKLRMDTDGVISDYVSEMLDETEVDETCASGRLSISETENEAETKA